MANRRARLAGLAAAVALTVLAHVLTTDSLLGVFAVIDIAGGLAISWAATAVVRAGRDPRMRGYVILSFALLGAIFFAPIPDSLRFRVGYGIHGALIGGAVGALLSIPLVPLLRRLQDLLTQGLVLTRDDLGTPVRWNRLARLAGLAAAIALTAVANLLTAARLTTGLWVRVMVEIVGGVAIGWAAISQFRLSSSESAHLAANKEPFTRSFNILMFALFGALGMVFAYPEPLGVRVGNGIHGALIGGAVAFLLAPFFRLVGVLVAPFFRWHQRREGEAEEGRAEALAAHEDLVTPVRLPTWNRRLAARVLDALLLWGAFRLLDVVDAATGPDTFLLNDAASDAEAWLSILLVWALYDIVLHPLFGATAGKALCRICVVDAGGAARVGVLRAARRWALLVVNLPFIWLQLLLSGDLLWSIDPRLSAMKPVYCGTILITAAERRRLRGLGAVERAAELAETFRAVRAIPGRLTRHQALVWLAILVAAACLWIGLTPWWTR